MLFTPPASEQQADAAPTETAIVAHPASFGTADTGLLEFTHTVEPGEGRLLLVSSHSVSNSHTTSSVTFDGAELTQLGGELVIDVEQVVGEDCNSTLWFLVDPPVGTFDILATLESDTKRMASWAISFSGVNTLNPIGSLITARDTTQVEAASLSVFSGSGDLVVDGICFGQPDPATLVAGEAQTVLLKETSVDNSLQVAASSKPGGPPNIMSWTHALGPNTYYSVTLLPAP